MKTKIFILLAVLLSLLGIQELRSQDTLWTKTFKESIDASLTIDGTKVLYTFWPGPTQQLCTADSGRVIWTTDSLHLFRGLMSPDSTTFLSYGITDSNTEYLTIRRLSDGAVIKRYDTLITNNYPKPLPLSWYIQSLVYSNDGRYLYCMTTDRTGLDVKNIHNNIYKLDLLTDQLVFLRQASSIYYMQFMKPDENYLIFDSEQGITFYTSDSLKKSKTYNGGGIFEISRSGRYITRINSDSLFTWDTQRDSIIKRNHLDSLKLGTLKYTSNDSLIILLTVINESYKIVVYNVFTSQIINSWYLQLPGDELTYGFELSPDDSKLLVIGHSEGIYMYDLTLLSTAKKDDNNPQTILQVNPNPALGNIGIVITLEHSEKMRVSLYDSNGDFVKEISNEIFTEGINQVSFNTKNLSNGIYFIRVAGSRVNQSSKLIINK